MDRTIHLITVVPEGDRTYFLNNTRDTVAGIALLVPILAELQARGCEVLSASASALDVPEVQLSSGAGLAGLGVEARWERESGCHDWYKATYKGVELIWPVVIPASDTVPVLPKRVL